MSSLNVNSDDDISWKVLEARQANSNEEYAYSCKLCLENYPTNQNKFTMESCGCFFCIECMKTYLEVLINDGVVLSLSCPDAECAIQGHVTQVEIMQLMESTTYEKYKRMKYEQEVSIDPERMFCIRPTCNNVCNVPTPSTTKHKSKKISTIVPMRITCVECEMSFCHICKGEWLQEQHTCMGVTTSISGEFVKLQTQANFALGGRSEALIKRCPVCNVLIEKDKGCAQMICRNCSHVFCWNCLKLLDNDFMLRHYDKGECKNFLGHSRAQVLRHRLGVVGLFTAFTLLLIIASPVLLLAGPIFLCYKYKDCCRRFWNREEVVALAQVTTATQTNQSQASYRKVTTGSTSKPIQTDLLMEEGSITSQSSTTDLQPNMIQS